MKNPVRLRSVHTLLLAMGWLTAAMLHSCAAASEFPPFIDNGDQPHITLTMPDSDASENDPDDSPRFRLNIEPERHADVRNQTPYPHSYNEQRQNHQGQKNPQQEYKRHEKQERKKTKNPEKPKHYGKTRAHQSGPYEISGVRIVDIHSGKVMPIDTVNLKPTLDRIAAGIKNPHRNDGTTFRNLSHKLPRKPRNYYREYVVPTQGIRGPGPQRLIIGENDEIYYTYDHYDSFIKVERD